jgi:hypothetical protein
MLSTGRISKKNKKQKTKTSLSHLIVNNCKISYIVHHQYCPWDFFEKKEKRKKKVESAYFRQIFLLPFYL